MFETFFIGNNMPRCDFNILVNPRLLVVACIISSIF